MSSTVSSVRQVLKRVSRDLATQADQSLSLPNPLSHHSFIPSERPHLSNAGVFPSPSSSFAQSAASALTSALPFPYPPPPAAVPASLPDASADFSNFLGTLTSEDWTTNGFGSPAAGDATNSLLTW